MIQSKADLRECISRAEQIASRLEYPAHKVSLGERRVIAALLRDLADIGRRAFCPDARTDWAIVPREPREQDDTPGLFPEAA